MDAKSLLKNNCLRTLGSQPEDRRTQISKTIMAAISLERTLDSKHIKTTKHAERLGEHSMPMAGDTKCATCLRKTMMATTKNINGTQRMLYRTVSSNPLLVSMVLLTIVYPTPHHNRTMQSEMPTYHKLNLSKIECSAFVFLEASKYVTHIFMYIRDQG
jgi:hypothetical protein